MTSGVCKILCEVPHISSPCRDPLPNQLEKILLRPEHRVFWRNLLQILAYHLARPMRHEMMKPYLTKGRYKVAGKSSVACH